MGTAGLMNHITREAISDEINSLIGVTANTNSSEFNLNNTAAGTQNITSSTPREDITTKLFEEKYPVVSGFSATLEWIGIILIFLGFLILTYEVINAGIDAYRAKKVLWKQLKNERDGRAFALSETFKSNKAYVIKLNASANKTNSNSSEEEGGKLIDNYEDEQDLANDMLNIERDKKKRSLERRLKARKRKQANGNKNSQVKVGPTGSLTDKDQEVRKTEVI